MPARAGARGAIMRRFRRRRLVCTRPIIACSVPGRSAGSVRLSFGPLKDRPARDRSSWRSVLLEAGRPRLDPPQDCSARSRRASRPACPEVGVLPGRCSDRPVRPDVELHPRVSGWRMSPDHRPVGITSGLSPRPRIPPASEPAWWRLDAGPAWAAGGRDGAPVRRRSSDTRHSAAGPRNRRRTCIRSCRSVPRGWPAADPDRNTRSSGEAPAPTPPPPRRRLDRPVRTPHSRWRRSRRIVADRPRRRRYRA